MTRPYGELHHSTRVLFCLLCLFLPRIALAQDTSLPTCPNVLTAPDYEARFGPVDYELKPSCVISWVQNDQLQQVIWQDSGDPDIVGLTETEDGTAVLVASRPPHLIDIDQDGWLDVAVFTLLGMVNGDYDIFRYDPTIERFGYFGTVWGSSFWRHEGGYLVAAGRSSAAASGIEAFRITDSGLIPQFGLYVDAGLQTGSDDAAECRVAIAGRTYVNPDAGFIAQIYPQAPDLITEYCKFYDPAEPSGDHLMDMVNDAMIVPAGTVFHCQLEASSKTVTVTRDDTGYSYAFGPRDGAPELEMHRPFDQVTVLPDNGAGPSRFGEITFTNAEYAYTVFYAYELFGDGAALYGDGGLVLDPRDSFMRGLAVTKDGRDSVFDRDCAPEGSFDRIMFLDQS